MDENGSFAALKLFLVFGPLLGLLLLDRYLLSRDRRRDEGEKGRVGAASNGNPPSA
ncbi:MAG: hypothetical protein RML45_13550 [Acetobacteraceae bacterium]|nr:hypothetical protein [Acetobacteraceae bacterium]